MQVQYIQKGRLKIAKQLEQFISQDVLTGLPLSTEEIWSKFADTLPELLSINQSVPMSGALFRFQGAE